MLRFADAEGLTITRASADVFFIARTNMFWSANANPVLTERNPRETGTALVSAGWAVPLDECLARAAGANPTM
jgi:hypothetical protein